MRIRVSDAAAALPLREHLALQGFPSTYVSADELEVLFPGSPTLFASAAELDLWSAEHTEVTLTYDTTTRRERDRLTVEVVAGVPVQRARNRPHALPPWPAHATRRPAADAVG
jgi:hypothetical protein